MSDASFPARVSVLVLSFALAACGDSSDEGGKGSGGSSATGGAGGATGGSGGAAGAGAAGGIGGSTAGSGGAAAGAGGGGTGGAAAGAGGGGTGGTGGTGTGGTGGTGTGGTGTGGTGTGGTGTGGTGTGGAGQCELAASPTCNTMKMPAAATFVTGVVGTVPTVSGGGVIPSGTYVLIKQIIASGTPATRKLAVYGGGDGCFTALEIAPDLTESRYSGTVSYSTSTSTTTFTCPLNLSVSPSFQVLAPVGGKVKYATLNLGDYREWLEQ